MEPTRAQLWREAEIAIQGGRHAEALAAVDRALRFFPDDVTFIVSRSALLRRLGDANQARETAARAIRLAPTFSEGYSQLGLSYLDQKKFGNAESAFRKAMEYHRTNPEAIRGLALLRLKQKRLAEAEATLLDGIRANPLVTDLYLTLGDVFAARGNQAGRIEAYRRARDLNPFDSDASTKYLAARREVGGLDAARSALEEAVARMPDVPQVHLQLALFMTENGLLEQAAASLRRALALDPALPRAIELLAGSKKFVSQDDTDYRLISEGYRLNAAGGAGRAATAFALAKAREDMHDFRSAFDCYVEANTILRRKDYSLDREARDFAAIREAFGPRLFSTFAGKGNNSQAPIFILGMPRSGTTLTETILSRHSGVYPAGELESFRAVSTGVVGASPIAEAPVFAERLRPGHLDKIGRGYLEELVDDAKASTHFTDKLPHNFRILGLIRLVFPEAKIIHVRRDPLDNCLSMFKSNFAAEGLAFTHDLADLGRYYNLYRGLMQHWRTVLPGEFLEIDYEALVTEPEATTKALFAYCGLDWSPDVLAIEDNRREVRTMSFAQVRQPIHTGSVSAAARYGSKLDPLRAALAEWDEAHS